MKLKRFLPSAIGAICSVVALATGLTAHAQTYDKAPAKAFWPMETASGFESPTVLSPEGGFSVASFDLNGNQAVGTSGVSWTDYQFIKLQPANGDSDVVRWQLKPSKGLTFTPTKISSWVTKFGTDSAPDKTIVTGKTADGKSVELGIYTAARNNKQREDDKYGKDAANYAQNFTIELSPEQQAELASAEGFILEITIGVNSSKQGGFSQVCIEGVLDGELVAVNKYPVSISAAPEEGGTVAIRPIADQYDEGTELTLTATEKFGYDFVSWTDADNKVVSENPEFKMTVTRADKLTANFKKVNTYSLTTNVTNGANDYMVQLSPAPTVIDGKNMYEEGAQVTLTALSNPILSFTNWSDGQTSGEIVVVMDGDKNLTAEYSAADYIVGWDFYRQGNNGRPADFAYEENDAATLNLRNADGDIQGWLDKSQLGANGYEGRPAAVNWRTSGLGDYYWQTKFNASAFKNIKVITSMVYNYNAYTKQNVEFSLDGENWETAGTVNLEGAKNWADAEFTLPASADNQPEVYLRWIADKTSNIDGTKSDNDGVALGGSYVIGEKELINDGKAPELLSTVPAEGASSASINGKIVLNFDEKVQLAKGAKATLNDAGIAGTANGKSVIFTYKNLTYGTDYEFQLAGNSIADLSGNYLAEPVKINFTTRTRPEVSKIVPDFIVPDNGDFRAAITAANNRQDKTQRYRIFVRNGEYMIPMDENNKVTVNGGTYPDVTLRLNASNVSIIGESMEGTVIINEVPDMDGIGSHPMEGIGNADLLQIQSGVSGTYFQDITLKHGISDNRGRNIVLQDKGDKTVMKNSCLWGYQDTYTSNNDKARYYFEGGVLRGRTDFLCGKGDAYFNGVTLQMCASGGYLAVPSVPKKYGYIFKDCEIKGENSTIDGNYTLGRPWGKGTPIALYIDTKMTAKPSAIGWNEMSGGYPARFAEYNSMTASGTEIDLSERKKIFADTHSNNPVLTKEEADANNYGAVMGGDDDWDPAMDCEQAPSATGLAYAEGKLTWDNSNYALCWAVYADSTLLGFTSESEYVPSVEGKTYGVRALNEMGGLGEIITVVGNGNGGDDDWELDAEVRAFPGAEGFGSVTTGGRGGKVYHVTNLDDSGEGSFRWACGQSGTRTIVFDVSGTIHLKSELRLKGDNVTIAGQTAPGDGICVADYPFVISANNVIIRFMRFRLGNEALKTNNKAHEGDGLGGMDKKNIIIDHCSVSWSIDECLSVYGSTNTTVQWCMVTQSLVDAGHSKGKHGYGGNWGGSGASYHHNLLAHHGSRTPRLGPRPGTQLDERMDLRNNVIYNYAGEGCYGGEAMTVNIVNNYYKPGPATNSGAKGKRMAKPGIRTFDYCIKDAQLKATAQNYNKVKGTNLTTCKLTVDSSDKGYLTFAGDDNKYEIDIENLCITVDGQKVKVDTNNWGPTLHKWGSYYIEGNVNSLYADVSADNWKIGLFDQIDKGSKVDYHNATEETLRAFTPMEFAAVTTHTADMAYDRVLEYAGASLSRDEYDRMMVDDTREGKASCIVSGIGKGFINSQDEITYADGSHGFPVLNSKEAPVDTDGDGMPDEWETSNGLNPNDAEDGPAVAENGYTNLENYINGLVAHIMKGGLAGGTRLDGNQEYGSAVDEITASPEFDNRIYNTQGIEVNEDARGILIQNGKKIIRK